jgi:3-methyladenine DNA glycosylase AlkD
LTSDTARDVVAALEELRSDAERDKIRQRLRPGEEVIGVRMRHLFDLSKASADLPLDEVQRLLDEPAYEPRLAAFCILDFKARRRGLDDDARRALYEMYLDNHDRITSWDMVDRAAPWVVGGYLTGRSLEPLRRLARADDPLQRRTAMTAPLYFVKKGSEDDLAGGFEIAALLVSDPDAIVCKPVGIFLKHAGTRDPDSLRSFLTEHAASMPRPALRLAIEKLDPAERKQWLGR